MIELSQFGLWPPGDLEAEKRMLREMLADAIRCWQMSATYGHADGNYYVTSRERLHREAAFWIFGEYDNRPFFSFAQVCQCLGLDTGFVRRRLLEWRRKAASTQPSAFSQSTFLVPADC
jgi:hypothetical protein